MSATSTARSWSLIAERNFGALWLGQIVSGFGDRITIVALADLTWRLTHSGLYTALAVILATVPYAVFGFFMGPIVDALGPRRVMFLCDLVRAVAVGIIPVLVELDLPLAVVYALVVVTSVCASAFSPARVALVPDLVPGARLGQANSLLIISDRAIEIVGFAAAGLLVAVVGTRAFYVDAATFAFSALMLRRIALGREGTGQALSAGFVLRDAGTGLRVIRSSTVLLLNMVFSFLAQMGLAVVTVLTPVFVFRELGGGADAFGAVEAAIAAGFLVAGPAVPALMRRVRKGTLVAAGFTAFGFLVVALGQVQSIEAAIVVFVLYGAANVVFFVPNMTIYQERVPAAVRSRVFTTRLALLNLTWLPVMLASGVLSEVTTVRFLITSAGLFTVLAAIAAVLAPSFRDVE